MNVTCESCGRRIALGSTVTKDCDGCIVAYMKLRKLHADNGGKQWPLSQWVLNRCREIGIEEIKL